MKTVLIALAVLSVSNIALASSSSIPARVQKIEAAAVLKSPEIAAHLNLEKQLHHLKCEKEKLADVTISEGGEMDSFEVVYGCRSSADDASIQRIRFSGGVYTESSESTVGYVVLTGMTIEMNN